MTIRITVTCAAALAAISLSATSASAGTIDFQDVGGGSCASYGASLNSGGYTFTGNPVDPNMFICNAGVVAQNTTQGLINANSTSVVTFSQIGGGAFSFNSFFAGTRTADFNPNAESSFYGTATGLTIVGQILGGGTATANISFNGLSFEQFFLPGTFTNLTSVTLTAQGNSRSVGPEFLIDDIVVDGAFAAVPEPSAWALLILGFGVVGGALRASRRQRAVLSYS